MLLENSSHCFFALDIFRVKRQNIVLLEIFGLTLRDENATELGAN